MDYVQSACILAKIMGPETGSSTLPLQHLDNEKIYKFNL